MVNMVLKEYGGEEYVDRYVTKVVTRIVTRHVTRYVTKPVTRIVTAVTTNYVTQVVPPAGGMVTRTRNVSPVSYGSTVRDRGIAAVGSRKDVGMLEEGMSLQEAIAKARQEQEKQKKGRSRDVETTSKAEEIAKLEEQGFSQEMKKQMYGKYSQQQQQQKSKEAKQEQQKSEEKSKGKEKGREVSSSSGAKAEEQKSASASSKAEEIAELEEKGLTEEKKKQMYGEHYQEQQSKGKKGEEKKGEKSSKAEEIAELEEQGLDEETRKQLYGKHSSKEKEKQRKEEQKKKGEEEKREREERKEKGREEEKKGGKEQEKKDSKEQQKEERKTRKRFFIYTKSRPDEEWELYSAVSDREAALRLAAQLEERGMLVKVVDSDGNVLYATRAQEAEVKEKEKEAETKESELKKGAREGKQREEKEGERPLEFIIYVKSREGEDWEIYSVVKSGEEALRLAKELEKRGLIVLVLSSEGEKVYASTVLRGEKGEELEEVIEKLMKRYEEYQRKLEEEKLREQKTRDTMHTGSEEAAKMMEEILERKRELGSLLSTAIDKVEDALAKLTVMAPAMKEDTYWSIRKQLEDLLRKLKSYYSNVTKVTDQQVLDLLSTVLVAEYWAQQIDKWFAEFMQQAIKMSTSTKMGGIGTQIQWLETGKHPVEEEIEKMLEKYRKLIEEGKLDQVKPDWAAAARWGISKVLDYISGAWLIDLAAQAANSLREMAKKEKDPLKQMLLKGLADAIQLAGYGGAVAQDILVILATGGTATPLVVGGALADAVDEFTYALSPTERELFKEFFDKVVKGDPEAMEQFAIAMIGMALAAGAATKLAKMKVKIHGKEIDLMDAVKDRMYEALKNLAERANAKGYTRVAEILNKLAMKYAPKAAVGTATLSPESLEVKVWYDPRAGKLMIEVRESGTAQLYTITKSIDPNVLKAISQKLNIGTDLLSRYFETLIKNIPRDRLDRVIESILDSFSDLVAFGRINESLAKLIKEAIESGKPIYVIGREYLALPELEKGTAKIRLYSIENPNKYIEIGIKKSGIFRVINAAGGSPEELIRKFALYVSREDIADLLTSSSKMTSPFLVFQTENEYLIFPIEGSARGIAIGIPREGVVSIDVGTGKVRLVVNDNIIDLPLDYFVKFTELKNIDLKSGKASYSIREIATLDLRKAALSPEQVKLVYDFFVYRLNNILKKLMKGEISVDEAMKEIENAGRVLKRIDGGEDLVAVAKEIVKQVKERKISFVMPIVEKSGEKLKLVLAAFVTTAGGTEAKIAETREGTKTETKTTTKSATAQTEAIQQIEKALSSSQQALELARSLAQRSRIDPETLAAILASAVGADRAMQILQTLLSGLKTVTVTVPREVVVPVELTDTVVVAVTTDIRQALHQVADRELRLALVPVYKDVYVPITVRDTEFVNVYRDAAERIGITQDRKLGLVIVPVNQVTTIPVTIGEVKTLDKQIDSVVSTGLKLDQELQLVVVPIAVESVLTVTKNEEQLVSIPEDSYLYASAVLDGDVETVVVPVTIEEVIAVPALEEVEIELKSRKTPPVPPKPPVPVPLPLPSQPAAKQPFEAMGEKLRAIKRGAQYEVVEL